MGLHGRHAFGPSLAEFVYPRGWHFDNGGTSKIDDVLTENGGLLDVPLLTALSTWIFNTPALVFCLSVRLSMVKTEFFPI